MSVPAILVTGATSGIGLAICELLAEEGYAILAHLHANTDAATQLRERIRSRGGICELAQADLEADHGPQQLADSVRQLVTGGEARRLHGVVNNAAVLFGPPADRITGPDIDRVFGLNLRAPVLLTTGLLDVIADGGSIVNISSASAHMSSPGNPLYAMSKAALESFTRNFAEVLAPRGIRINAVVPGFTDNGHAAFSDPTAVTYMSSFSPLGGVAAPSVTAQAVAFLISSKSSRTTGTLLDVSGGSTLGARGNRAKSIRDVMPLDERADSGKSPRRA